MFFNQNFTEWLKIYEGFFVFENVKPIAPKVKQQILDRFLSKADIKDEEEKKQFLIKAQNLIAEFEKMRGFPLEWWMAETIDENRPGMKDDRIVLEPNIPFEKRNDISQYQNIEQLIRIINHANDVIDSAPRIPASLKKAVIKKLVQNGASEEDATQKVNKFDSHKSFFNLKEFKKYMLSKGTDGNMGMADDDFSLAYPEKKIPDIAPEQRYNLRNYEYVEQLEKIIDRMDATNIRRMQKMKATDSGELTLEEKFQKEAQLLSNIDKVVDDEFYVIYRPKTAEESIAIKAAEPFAQKEYPSWCICYTSTSNYFNNYRYNAGQRTFYLVKNKKILNPCKPQDPWNFFVVGVEKREGGKILFIVTPNPNGDRELTAGQLASTVNDFNKSRFVPTVKENAQEANITAEMPDFSEYIKFFTHVPLTSVEREMRNKFEKNISVEDYKKLGMTNVYFKDGQEIEDTEEIQKLNSMTELPQGIEKMVISKKNMFLDICGINNNIGLDVFMAMPKEHQNKYVGYIKAISDDVVQHLLKLADKGEQALAKRYATSANRVLENDGYASLGKTNTIATLFTKFFDNITPKALVKANQELISVMFTKLPDMKKWKEKFTSDTKSFGSFTGKLDDNAKTAWIKVEFTNNGIAETLNDPFMKTLFTNINTKQLSNLFTEFGMDKILNSIKPEEIRPLNDSRSWSEILAVQKFQNLIKYLPKELVKNLGPKTVVGTFLTSDEEGAKQILEFFNYGPNFLLEIIRDPNSQDGRKIISELFPLNPQRFGSLMTGEFINSINYESLNAILQAMPDKKAEFSNFVIRNAKEFKTFIINSMLINTPQDAQIDLVNNILTAAGNKLTINNAFEILSSISNPKINKVVTEKLKPYLQKLSPSMVARLATIHGPKFVHDTYGPEVLDKLEEEEDPEEEKEGKFEPFFQGLRSTFEKSDVSDEQEQDGEDKERYSKKKQDILDYINLSKNPTKRKPSFFDWAGVGTPREHRQIIINNFLKNKKLNLTGDFLAKMLGLAENKDTTWELIKEQNPENLQKLKAMPIPELLAHLSLTTPAQFSDQGRALFFNDLGDAVAKAFAQDAVKHAGTPTRIGKGSMHWNLLKNSAAKKNIELERIYKDLATAHGIAWPE